MTPAHFTPARQLRGRRARARFVRELLPRPGAALRARHGRTWAPWRRPSAGSPSRDRALGRVSWDLAEGAATRSRPVHQPGHPRDARSPGAARLGALREPSFRPREDSGALSAGEADRFGGADAMRSHFSLVANKGRGSVNRSPQGAIRGGFAVSPQKSERFARCARRGGALARPRRERRASTMNAAWNSSPALSPVPWGERSREAFNSVPGG